MVSYITLKYYCGKTFSSLFSYRIYEDLYSYLSVISTHLWIVYMDNNNKNIENNNLKCRIFTLESKYCSGKIILDNSLYLIYKYE